MRKLTAELFGTFSLVFAGTGAIIINDVSGGTVSHVGVALTFGLIVLAMIYAVGDVSGCHLNPAVTLGFVAARRFSARWIAPYIASQMIAAISASLTLRLMFPSHKTLGATLLAGGRSDAARSTPDERNGDHNQHKCGRLRHRGDVVHADLRGHHIADPRRRGRVENPEVLHVGQIDGQRLW